MDSQQQQLEMNDAEDLELHDAVSRYEADTEQRQTDEHGNKWPG